MLYSILTCWEYQVSSICIVRAHESRKTPARNNKYSQKTFVTTNLTADVREHTE
jgi:hypothetical protein